MLLNRRLPRTERGQTLVEFALILPILLALTVGLVDAGRAVYYFNATAHSARSAARYGAVYGGSQHPSFNWVNSFNGNSEGIYSAAGGHAPDSYPETTIVGTAANASPMLSGNELVVQITPLGTDTSRFSPGTQLRVTVSYTFTPSMPLLSEFPIRMSSDTTATIE